MRPRVLLLAMLCGLCLGGGLRRSPGQALPDSIHAEGVPPIPPELDATVDLYKFTELALFQGWFAGTRRVLFLGGSGLHTQAFLGGRPGETPRPLTGLGPPVSGVCSHPKRERLVIATDDEGAENYHFDLFDVPTGESRHFTSPRCRCRDPVWSRSGRLLALTSDARNGRDWDLYVVNPPHTSTGRRLVTASGTCIAQDWSPDDARLAAVEWSSDRKKSRVLLVDVKTGATEALPSPPGRQVERKSVRFARGGKALYWLTDRGSEFLHLARYDLDSGRETPLTEGIPWDVEQFALSGDGELIAFVVNEDGRSRLRALATRTGTEKRIPRLEDGRYSGLAFRPGSHEIGFRWSSDRSPPGVYSFDLDQGWKTEWVTPRAIDPRAESVPVHELVHYPTFDGREVPAFVRLPGPQFRGPRPVLVILHGGPAMQYRPEFSLLQNVLLGELGIALVMPNVRGSTGYGRAYERLDDRLRREDAVRDVGALLDWIATRPELDASRVAVSGASHGGYLALASLARFGDRLRAGIDVSGFSDFESSLKGQRASAIDYWRGEFGDERDPETLRYLRSISPLTNADRIRQPLLVVHGKNDPRVKVAEGERIVAAVRRNGTPVWYVLFHGEGHGFDALGHGDFLLKTQVLFLQQFLLGREWSPLRTAGPPGGGRGG